MIGPGGRRARRAAALAPAGLRGGRAFYEAVAREASDELLVTDDAGTILFASPTFERRFDLQPDALVGRDAFTWVVPEHRAAARGVLRAVVAGSGPRDSEHLIRLADGEQRWVRARLSNALHVPDVTGIVWNCQDVTSTRAAEDALRRAAFHDALTGLANRRMLQTRLAQVLTDAAPGDAAGLVLLNLDGLKGVNDRYGHAGGDEVVATAARRLAEVLAGVAGNPLLARLDGDEFAVLLHLRPPRDGGGGGGGGDGDGGDGPADVVAGVAGAALAAVSRPVDLDGRPVVVTTSVGSTVVAAPGGSTGEAGGAGGAGAELGRRLFREADVALAAAKARGGAQRVAFTPSLLTAAHERAELAVDLRAALTRGALDVAYQPLVDLGTGRTVGFEALVRWNDPVRGPVPPAVFVPLAEESDTIDALGAFVLREALGRWGTFSRAAGRDDLEVSVNLSGRQLVRPGLVDEVHEVLRETGVPAGRLCLEVTESAVVSDLSAARDTLLALRALGARTALDDFGTGYSSLSYLRRLPVDILKIDKSFVDDDSDGAAVALLTGIASLSSALGLLTVAEGIETPAARDLVRGAGCTWGQGFLFERPLTAAEAVRHLERERARARS